jgi:hypothetical protein
MESSATLYLLPHDFVVVHKFSNPASSIANSFSMEGAACAILFFLINDQPKTFSDYGMTK